MALVRLPVPYVPLPLQMPTRDPATQEVRWEAPHYSIVSSLLPQPLYAGAYAYGRREPRAVLVDGQVRRGLHRRAQDAWLVCLRDHHPA